MDYLKESEILMRARGCREDYIVYICSIIRTLSEDGQRRLYNRAKNNTRKMVKKDDELYRVYVAMLYKAREYGYKEISESELKTYKPRPKSRFMAGGG